MDAYGVQHALLVGPSSGYRTDNRCLLHALAQGEGRFKRVAVVDHDTGLDELAALKEQGVGLLIDHCGRPEICAGASASQGSRRYWGWPGVVAPA